MLWLWRRPVATAPIQPLAWEPPYAEGAAQEIATTTTTKRQKKKKKIPKVQSMKEIMEKLGFFIFLFFVFLGPHLWYMELPRLGVESEL